MTKMYVMELSASQVTALVLINGVKVYEGENIDRLTTQFKVKHALDQGKNTYQIYLSKVEEIFPKFEVKLLSGKKGTQPGDENVEFSFKLDESLTPLDETPQLVWDQKFDIDDEIPAMSWQAAIDVDNISGEQVDILTVIRKIEAELTNKNVQGILDLFKMKHENTASALGVTVGQIELGLSDFLSQLFEDPEFKVIPVDEEQLKFNLQENKKLVDIKHLSHPSVINVKSSTMPLVLEVAMAKFLDGWKIV